MMSPSCSSQCGSASPNTVSQLSNGRVSCRPRFTVPAPCMLFSTICSTLANLGDRNSPHSPCSGNLSCVKGLMKSISQRIAEALGVRDEQIAAAVALLDGGSTVPFIARYRKEVTGSLDDAQLRTLEERLRYLRELEDRRKVILESVREQGKLDPTLEAAIMAADSKGRLEDIYLPYKPKRRTKAEIAKEAGLEPLADALLAHPEKEPQAVAVPFIDPDKQVADAVAALDGARSILVERFAEDADLIGALREQMWSNGLMASSVRTGKKAA